MPPNEPQQSNVMYLDHVQRLFTFSHWKKTYQGTARAGATASSRDITWLCALRSSTIGIASYFTLVCHCFRTREEKNHDIMMKLLRMCSKKPPTPIVPLERFRVSEAQAWQ